MVCGGSFCLNRFCSPSVDQMSPSRASLIWSGIVSNFPLQPGWEARPRDRSRAQDIIPKRTLGTAFSPKDHFGKATLTWNQNTVEAKELEYDCPPTPKPKEEGKPA